MRSILRTLSTLKTLVQALAQGQGLADLRDIDGVLMSAPDPLVSVLKTGYSACNILFLLVLSCGLRKLLFLALRFQFQIFGLNDMIEAKKTVFRQLHTRCWNQLK